MSQVLVKSNPEWTRKPEMRWVEEAEGNTNSCDICHPPLVIPYNCTTIAQLQRDNHRPTTKTQPSPNYKDTTCWWIYASIVLPARPTTGGRTTRHTLHSSCNKLAYTNREVLDVKVKIWYHGQAYLLLKAHMGTHCSKNNVQSGTFLSCVVALLWS